MRSKTENKRKCNFCGKAIGDSFPVECNQVGNNGKIACWRWNHFVQLTWSWWNRRNKHILWGSYFSLKKKFDNKSGKIAWYQTAWQNQPTVLKAAIFTKWALIRLTLKGGSFRSLCLHAEHQSEYGAYVKVKWFGRIQGMVHLDNQTSSPASRCHTMTKSAWTQETK